MKHIYVGVSVTVALFIFRYISKQHSVAVRWNTTVSGNLEAYVLSFGEMRCVDTRVTGQMH